jgi:hypothetical protein
MSHEIEYKIERGEFRRYNVRGYCAVCGVWYEIETNDIMQSLFDEIAQQIVSEACKHEIKID